jgi:hypothetical protein
MEVAIAAWRRLWNSGRSQDGERDENVVEDQRRRTRKRKKKKQRKTKRKTTTRQQQQLYQQTLQGENQDLADGETFGDTMGDVHERFFRVGLHNIQRLPKDKRNGKSRTLVETIKNKQFDAMMMTEVGLCWPKVPSTDQWHERVQGVFQDSRTCFAFNDTELEDTELSQWGGVGICTTGDLTKFQKGSGKDATGLGRWTWTTLEGKQNHRVQIISVYRPVDGDGPQTVFAQHKRFFQREQGLNRDPRTAFYKDLYEQMIPWLDDGDHIILGIDANEDVRTGDTKEFCRSLGLKDMILDRHKSLSPPATCDKNTNREPIDAIFATAGLTAKFGGYLAYGDGTPSDHRILWVDIDYSVLGYDNPISSPKNIRRLHTRDPRLVEKYNLRVEKALRSTGLLDRLQKIKQEALELGWSDELQEEYNRISTLNTQLRKNIERSIRKLRMGAIPWSPRLQVYRDKIEIWQMLLKKRSGRKISNRKLRRLLCKSDIDGAYELNLVQLSAKLDEAFREYKQAKKNALVWREDSFQSLAEARAKRNGTEVEAELKQLQEQERQKRTHRNIKRMRKKINKTATTMVFTSHEGARVAVTDKEKIEEACTVENNA